MWLSDEWKDYEVYRHLEWGKASAGESISSCARTPGHLDDAEAAPAGANTTQNTAGPTPAAANGPICACLSSGRCIIKS